MRRDVGGSSIAAVVNTRDKSFGNYHESIKSSGALGSEGPPNVRDVPRLSDGGTNISESPSHSEQGANSGGHVSDSIERRTGYVGNVHASDGDGRANGSVEGCVPQSNE